MTTTISYKIEHQGELRRLPAGYSYAQIIEASRSMFAIQQPIQFKWCDADGDLITLSSQNELADAQEYAKSLQWKTIRLRLAFIVEKPQDKKKRKQNKKKNGDGKLQEPQADGKLQEPQAEPATAEHHLKVLALDRSGSMASFGSEMQSGVDTFLQQSLKNKPEANTISVSILAFDDKVEIPLQAAILDESVCVKQQWIEPRGMTALRDGIKRAIDTADELVASERNEITSKTCEIVIFTDGAENCSHEISECDLNRLIKDRTNQGYVFTFLAANQNAIAAASQLGIGAGRAMTCSGDREHQQAAWKACTESPMRTPFSAQQRMTSCSTVDASRYHKPSGAPAVPAMVWQASHVAGATAVAGAVAGGLFGFGRASSQGF
jgi:uncharacterized protein YegL